MSARDEFARDRNGKLIVDRYGRPVRKRSPLPSTTPPAEVSAPTETSRLSAPSTPHTPHAEQTNRLNRPQRTREERERVELARLERERAERAQRIRQAREQEQAQRTPQRKEAQKKEPRKTPTHAATPEPPRYRRNASQDSSHSTIGSETRIEPMLIAQQPSRRSHATGSAQPSHSAETSSVRKADKNLTKNPKQAHNAPARKGASRGKRGGVRKIFGGIAALLVIFLVISVGTAIWLDGKFQRTDAIQDYEGRVGNTAGTNWLLVGSDSRAGMTADDAHRLMAGELDDGVGRTDTIMLVHIPRLGGGKATMLSFPRDSWVTIPGHGENKLNAAFTLGGPALLQRTLEEATGLRIDRYAEIGFGGFANVVDGVGGITMCLDEPLVDDMAGIALDAGCQELDGPTALGYVRSRYVSAGGDLDRVDRQKQFLAALSSQLSSAGTVLNPFKLFPILNTLASSLTLNNKDHVWNLGRLGLAIAGGAEQLTVPIGDYADTWAGNAALWDEAAAEDIFARLR